MGLLADLEFLSFCWNRIQVCFGSLSDVTHLIVIEPLQRLCMDIRLHGALHGPTASLFSAYIIPALYPFVIFIPHTVELRGPTQGGRQHHLQARRHHLMDGVGTEMLLMTILRLFYTLDFFCTPLPGISWNLGSRRNTTRNAARRIGAEGWWR
jgi:hypothetical protein